MEKSWRRKTDREIANLLGRSLYSVRSFRVRNIVRRRLGDRYRWKGNSGRRLSRLIIAEYIRGSSQSRLVQKYGVEWRKLKDILLSKDVQIRGKSQQVFIQKYGRAPRIRSQLSASKLYGDMRNVGRQPPPHRPVEVENAHYRRRCWPRQRLCCRVGREFRTRIWGQTSPLI